MSDLMRIAAVPAVRAVDMLAVMMAEPEQSERPADIFGAARRSDRPRKRAERPQEIRNARHRVEPFHIARPRARPVRLAKIGRKRPPVSRLDPPLRLLPIMAIIVAQTLDRKRT